jgi:AcrR family transcriptional regulator
VTATDKRPYHHGHLRQVLIDAAVAEVETVGASALSLRAIARRAGVSHAAPAHHFGDKAGVFTAIAIEGFDLMTKTITPVAFGEEGFIVGGTAYVQFALEHPGYFEVMFRPTLYDLDDPALISSRDGAFDVLLESARHAIDPSAPHEEAQALAIAGWSLSHGFSTLWLQANLVDRIGADPFEQVARGVVALGEIVRRSRDAQASPDS